MFKVNKNFSEVFEVRPIIQVRAGNQFERKR